MQLHKIMSQGESVEVIARTELQDGPVEYMSILVSIEDAPVWIGRFQAALEQSSRTRKAAQEHHRKELQRQQQDLRRQLQQIELQLAACDFSSTEGAEPVIDGFMISEGLAHSERVGPPTARSAT